MNPHFTDFLSSQQPDEELKVEIMEEEDEFLSYVSKKIISGGHGMLSKEKADDHRHGIISDGRMKDDSS